MDKWNAADAKAHFADIMEEATRQPQVILRHGKPAGVVINYKSFVQNRAAIESPMSSWLKDLETINTREGDMDPVIRLDRPLPEELR